MLFSEAVEANRDAVEHLTTPQMRALLPVMQQAEKEVTAALSRFLRDSSGDETYTIAKHRAMLGQLREAMFTIEHSLGTAMGRDLVADGEPTVHHAMNNLMRMIEIGERQFEGAIAPLRIDVAAVMARAQRMAVSRFETSAKRYAGDVGKDLRARMMLGVIRGETVDQLTARLLGSEALRARFAEMGTIHVADGIAGQVFNSMHYRAERLARTELNNAYNYTQLRGIVEADKADPGYLKRWDAARDKHVCPVCAELDETTIKPDETFKGGIDHPPIHPCDRCSLIPWRAGWQM